MTAPVYNIIEKINAGGMAEIFLGVAYNDFGFDQIVSIKRLNPKYNTDKTAQDLFLREANILRKLNHTNINNFVGFAEIEGLRSMVMGFVHGHNARDLLEFSKKLKMKVSVSMAVHIATEVARGLHYCHTFKDTAKNENMCIVHSDISPENILISYEGEIKIIDFGVAQVPGAEGFEHDGKLKGKLRYMSPEFIKTSIGSPSSDIYSLGMVLYELLIGEDLFVGQHIEDIYEKKLSPPLAESLIEKNDLLDLELAEIVLKCITPDPKQRFESALELERHLSLYFHRRDPEYMPRKLGNFLKQIFTKDHKKVESIIQHSVIHKKDDAVADSILIGADEKTKVPQSVEEILKLFKNKEADVPIVHRGRTLELSGESDTIQLAVPRDSRIKQKPAPIRTGKTNQPSAVSNHSSHTSQRNRVDSNRSSNRSSRSQHGGTSSGRRSSSRSSIKRRPKERIIKKDNTNQILQIILVVAIVIVFLLFLRSNTSLAIRIRSLF